MKEIRSEVKKPIQGFYNKAMDNLLRRVFELMLAGGALSQSENEVRSTNAKHQFESLSKTNDEKSNRDRWKMIRYLKESGRITGLVSKIFMRFRPIWMDFETTQDSGLGRPRSKKFSIIKDTPFI